MLAHVGGVPVEEALMLLPAAAAGGGAWATAWWRARRARGRGD